MEFEYIKLINYKNHPDTCSLYLKDHISEHEYLELADFLRDCLFKGTKYAIKKQGGYACLAANPAYWSFYITLAIKAEIDGHPRIVKYKLEINEKMSVSTEAVIYQREMYDASIGIYFLNFSNGVGSIITNEKEYLEGSPDWVPCQKQEELPNRYMLAINTFGRLPEYPVAHAIYQFINVWLL